MNANELADYLLNFIMMIEDYDESKHENAATMLRQQQSEIYSLKLQNDNCWLIVEILRQKVKAQDK